MDNRPGKLTVHTRIVLRTIQHRQLLLLKIDIEGEALVIPAAVSLLREQRPTFTFFACPAYGRATVGHRNHQITRYLPFLYSNQGKLITAKFLLVAPISKGFEIIATDLTPAELGEKLARSPSFQKQPTAPQQEELGKIFGKRTDAAKVSWIMTRPMSDGWPFTRRLNRSRPTFKNLIRSYNKVYRAAGSLLEAKLILKRSE